MCVCVRACVRACLRVRACVCVCVCVCMVSFTGFNNFPHNYCFPMHTLKRFETGFGFCLVELVYFRCKFTNLNLNQCRQGYFWKDEFILLTHKARLTLVPGMWEQVLI